MKYTFVRLGLRRLVFLLVLVLIFEGVIRKLLPGTVSNYFILIKDVLVVVMLLIVSQVALSQLSRFFLTLVVILAVLLMPLILFTATKDVVLVSCPIIKLN